MEAVEKDRLKRIKNIILKLIPFVLLFVAMLCVNRFKSVSYGDDTWFAGITTGKVTKEVTSMSSYMKWRYETWSSRLIIEFFLIIFAQSGSSLWRVIDAGIWVLLAYSIYRVFFYKKSQEEENFYKRWLTVFLVALIPQNILCTAGWIATTLNYTWVIAFGVFSLIPIRKCLDSEKIKFYEYPFFILAGLYATNSEQMCAVLFMVYLIFSIYFLIKKKIKPIVFIMFIISIISLIVIFKCPGNSARTEKEITAYFKNFETLSTMDKLEISIVSTMQYFIFNFNIIYVIFTFFLMYTCYRKYKKNIVIRIIATFPFLMGIAFNVLNPITSTCFPEIFNGLTFMNVQNNASFMGNAKLSSFEAIFPIILSTAILASIVISVYFSFGNTKKTIVALLCIGAGICTRMLMGFMPSVYVSGNRTQLIFIVSMLILTVLMMENEKKTKLSKYINVLIIFEIITFMNNITLALSIR